MANPLTSRIEKQDSIDEPRSKREQPTRLTTKEIADLMRKREIPVVTNQCVRRFQPLARVEGEIRCVREDLTEFCDCCAFYASRFFGAQPPDSRGSDEVLSTLGSIEKYPVEFESILRELSKDRQYVFNVPINELRRHSYLLRRINCRFKISIEPVEES